MSAPYAKGDETCGSQRLTQASLPLKTNGANENVGSMRPLKTNYSYSRMKSNKNKKPSV